MFTSDADEDFSYAKWMEELKTCISLANVFIQRIIGSLINRRTIAFTFYFLQNATLGNIWWQYLLYLNLRFGKISSFFGCDCWYIYTFAVGGVFYILPPIPRRLSYFRTIFNRKFTRWSGRFKLYGSKSFAGYLRRRFRCPNWMWGRWRRRWRFRSDFT